MQHPRILVLFGGAALFGQERGNIEALAALQDQGAKILCLIRDEEWSNHVAPALSARGLPFLKVPYVDPGNPRRWRSILLRSPIDFVRANWAFLRIARAFNPSHIHAFNPVYVLNFLAALSVHRMPMVYRMGDEPILHNWIWRTLWKYVIWRTDRFVVNSQFVARSLTATGVASDDITVVYNAPPRRDHRLTTSTSLAVKRDSALVSYVGQITELKGVHVLIDAFRMIVSDFPNARLEIAGRISRWSGDAWAHRLRDSVYADDRLQERITFLGDIEDVAELFSRSIVHVTPSLFNDPSPNVVMEAKQQHCPSIVFPNGGMPELVDDGVDGAVCHEPTAEALASKLRFYLSDPGAARRQGEAAYKSLTKLGIPQFANTWLDVYSRAALCDTGRQNYPPITTSNEQQIKQ